MRAVVCGAGIAGWTTAWWLRRAGWQVHLVERADGPRSGGYMMDFFGAGFDVAERMGLLPALREVHTGVTEVRYVDPTGRRTGGFRYRLFEQLYGGRVLSFMRGDLERVLRDAALGARATVSYGRGVTGVHQRGDDVLVTLAGGGRVTTDLLVGADGLHSTVRRLCFGPQTRWLRYLGYQTASYTFVDDSVAERVGDRFVLVEAPGRQAGVYPTTHGDLACSLIHRTDRSVLPAEPAAEVRARYSGLGALVDRVLEHCPAGDRLYYDLVAQVELPRWVHGRTVLVGDACQAVSLMAGQGASMAMAGGYVLATSLESGAGPAAGLRRYEDLLRPLIADTQEAGRRTARWLVPETRRRIAVRNAMLAVAGLPGAAAVLRPVTRGTRHRIVEPR